MLTVCRCRCSGELQVLAYWGKSINGSRSLWEPHINIMNPVKSSGIFTILQHWVPEWGGEKKNTSSYLFWASHQRSHFCSSLLHLPPLQVLCFPNTGYAALPAGYSPVLRTALVLHAGFSKSLCTTKDQTLGCPFRVGVGTWPEGQQVPLATPWGGHGAAPSGRTCIQWSTERR